MVRPLKKSAAETMQPGWGEPSAPSRDARRLQQELERALAGAPAGEARWSQRSSLGFIVATNGAFWIALVWAVRAALS